MERLARNFDLIFSTLRLERDYVDAADRRLTQLTGCRRARKGVQCQVAVSNPEGKPSSGNDRDPTPQPPQTQSFIGAPLDVGRPAVVIAPPLKGPRWVVAGGCCDTITYHRGATLPINGESQKCQQRP